MLTLYIITALVGGALVLLSAFGGGDGDADHDVDHELEAETAGELESGADHDSELEAETWIPFLGLRFWTYFAAAFGVTGLLLTALTGTAPLIIAAVAAGTGIASGTTISYALHFVKQGQAHSGAAVDDLIGTEGKVLVAVGGKELPGKIRCRVKGEILDLTAESDDGGAPLEIGAEIVIIAMRGTRATVIRRAALDAPSTAPQAKLLAEKNKETGG